jgi:thymidylate synthase ThyX
MATLLPQSYDPSLGVTEPPAFGETGLSGAYAEVCRASQELHDRIRAVAPPVAAYALTNGHRRRVLFKANARELYHLARLRLDAHAQWDIRRLAQDMIALAQEKLPLVLLLAAGKDRFEEARHAALGE